MNCSLDISNFLEEIFSFSHSVVSSISLHWSLRKASFSLLVILWNSAFKWVYPSFSPLLFTSLLFPAICKAASDSHFAFLHFFFLGMVLIPDYSTVPRTSIHTSSGTLSIRVYLFIYFFGVLLLHNVVLVSAAPWSESAILQQHKRWRCTWTAPDGQYQNQTDYILCSWKWRSSRRSAKTRLGADCGSDHELFIAKFRLKLKKVGKTTRPFTYDLNQIPYDYIEEVRNRFKGLDLIDRVPEELWMEVCDIV